MKNNFTKGAVALLILFASCKKEESASGPGPVTPPPAETIGIDLGQKEIKYGASPISLDFDNDGTRDFLFSVTLVGDPAMGLVKRKFMASSGVKSLFAVNENEEVPCMNKGENIPLDDFNGYNWNLVLAVKLVERTENMAGEINWYGNWKGAVKKYLPFQMMINNQRHNGWVELSIDITSQKVVLHKAVYTKEAEKEIKAGE